MSERPFRSDTIYPFLLKSLSWAVCFSAFTCLVVYPYGSDAKAAGPEKVIKNAMIVMKEIKNAPDGGILKELLARCEGLAIFPSVYKEGFIVGASYGKGLMVTRDPKTGKWRGPAFDPVSGKSPLHFAGKVHMAALKKALSM